MGGGGRDREGRRKRDGMWKGSVEGQRGGEMCWRKRASRGLLERARVWTDGSSAWEPCSSCEKREGGVQGSGDTDEGVTEEENEKKSSRRWCAALAMIVVVPANAAEASTSVSKAVEGKREKEEEDEEVVVERRQRG